MDAAELKLVFASNLINLRTAAGMTQAELGVQLNYSDKTVSKWERGEAIPDAYVLTELSDLFHVTVDYLLSSHDAWQSPEEIRKANEPMYSSDIIIAVTILGIMTASLTAFVIGWICGIIEWRIFLVGLVLSAVAFLVLDCIFNHARYLKPAMIVLIISVFVLVYFLLWDFKPWQIFLLLVPAITIALLSTHINKKPKKRNSAGNNRK
ncbi:MAG: helix-turn-helix transcriptional regulator [Oscillospiraceae bacterium]|jgi:transcriptional regulator with XRE-family HTH domain|nr:helix-turn-helix transcriptional regulator [Oscillospiraceae bacterium]